MIKHLLFYTLLCTLFSSCYIIRAYRSRNFELKDLPRHPSQVVQKSTTPFYFHTNLNDDRFKKLQVFLDTNLQNSQTYSFTVIKNDTIIYDKYFDGLTQQNIFPSFSVAKSFVGTLVQMAHQEGKIKSLQDPITNYLPYLLKRDKRFANITIQHLLDMRSGIKSNENYGSPFSDVIKLGFRSNIQHQLKRLKIAQPPGKLEYISVNSQLLGMIVQQATGKKLYDYLQEKIWQPLGMEADATWNVDSKRHKVAKAFCCINAVAHDFAKLGRLYLNGGNWNGAQLLDSNWVITTTSPDSMYKYEEYKNQWWQANTGIKYFSDSLEGVQFTRKFERNGNVIRYNFPDPKMQFFIEFPFPDYEAEGILGQYIYVNPFRKVIIVRTGHYWNLRGYSEEALFSYTSFLAMMVNYPAY